MVLNKQFIQDKICHKYNKYVNFILNLIKIMILENKNKDLIIGLLILLILDLEKFKKIQFITKLNKF